MELGNRLVRAEDIDRLAAVYGCSADSLFVSSEQGAQRNADDLANIAQTIPELGTDTHALAALSEAVAISRARSPEDWALHETRRRNEQDCPIGDCGRR